MTQPPLPPRPSRRFYADDILSGRVNLDGYPFRYIYLQPSMGGAMGAAFSFGAQIPNEVDKILTAAEFLETRGWEVVNLEQGGLIAHLRRRHR
ncbi:hypothetical protein I0C86_02960 [Plantactinospora sp. S1510]|uniref:Uncharacterized protein n=1 Tax=Plantactinospora alkalitolerans TaxID=2789879 RepID=A0ABS0GP39_9ACTN|nr:hypothetical protein [Plantactinospora alkalitolerans]MBF9127961.1 hypothetical protein [Plantactinospora alkalitolerans]